MQVIPDDVNDSELIQIEREYCSRSLRNFQERSWKQIEPPTQVYKSNWAIHAICDHLDAVEQGHITRLAMLVPPGLSKSTTTSVNFPAYLWGPKNKAHSRIISVSHSLEFAIRDTSKTQALISSEWYQNLWPVQLKKNQKQKKNFANTKFGLRQCFPMGSVTGARADIVIVDDPLTIEDGKSLDRAALQTANRIFRETIPSRVNDPMLSSIILIMQVTGQGDVSFVAREAGYEILMLPMEFDPARKCFTSIGFEDPRTEDKELLFPERFPQVWVNREKIIMGTVAWSAQMQQNPIPREGNILKSSHIQLYEILPTFKCRKIFADTAQKTEKRHDYSVFQCWGEAHNGHLYLIDQIRGKWEAPELKARAIAFWIKHIQLDYRTHGHLRGMYVEDKASGTSLIQEIKKEGRITIFPIKLEDRSTVNSKNQIIRRRSSSIISLSRDKYSRALDVLPVLEAKMVWAPKNAPWLSDFLSELDAFTADDTHLHDDQIDPMVYAIVVMVLCNSMPWWQQLIEQKTP